MPKTVRLIEQRQSTSLASRVMDSLRSYTLGPMSLKDPALAAFFGGGRSTSAGITVSDEMAFMYSAVFAAVNIISSDVAKLPLNLMKRRKDGGNDVFYASKLYKLLKDEPNPDMSSLVFRRTLTAHALTTHGGYAEIERDGAGRPSALWILTPNRVQPFLDKVRLPNGLYRGRLRYRVDGSTIVESDDMIHLQGLGYDGYRSYPLIDMARQAIGLALAAEQFGATFFSNGTTFGGVMSTDTTLSPEAEDAIKKNVAAYHASADKAHRLLFLSGGWKYTKTGVAPNEAQMDELRDKQVEEVARFFNIPLHKLKLNKPGAVSYSSVEMADLDYYKGTLLTWVQIWEQELNRKLIPTLEYGIQSVKHNLNGLLRADTAARQAFYTALLDRGVLNADMVLELEDMNPQDNGLGKTYYLQGAMVPKDKIGDLVEAQIKAKSTKNQPPAPAPVPEPDPNMKREIEQALERLAAAEVVAAEARAAAQQEREARIALEATGTAQAEEIGRRAESERVLFARAADYEVVVAGCRSDVEARRVAQEQADAEIVRLRAESEARQASLDAVTLERDARAAEVGVETARVVALEASVARAREEATASQAALEASRQAMADLETARAALETDLTQSRADQDALRAQHAAALVAAADADVVRVQAEQRASEAAGAVTEARAAVDRCLEDVRRLASDQQADRAARDAAEERRVAAEDARVAAIQRAEALRLEAEAADVRTQAAIAEREALGSTAVTINARVAELEAREQQAEQDRVLREAVTAGLVTQVEAARVLSEDLTNRLTAAETERDSLRQSLALTETAREAMQETIRAAEQVRAETLAASVSERATGDAERSALDRKLAEQAEQIAAADVARRELEAVREQTAAELRTADTLRQSREVESAAAQSAADARREALEQQIGARAAEIAELERGLREVREADARGVAAVISSHRALVADIMRQMIEWETERLRRSQATPAKLRASLDHFYDGFTDLVRRRLEPVVAVHLAFIRSDLDPQEEARRLAEGHVRDSRRQLEVTLDGEESDAFAGSVTALWHRWETERPGQIADALMQKELNYARQR